MPPTMRPLLLGSLLVLAGCVVRATPAAPPTHQVVVFRPPPPAPPPVVVRPAPPPPRGPMGYEEAVARGMDYCRDNGLPCVLRDAHLTGNAMWMLKYDLAGGGKGHLHLDLDGYSGRVVKVDQKWKPKHGHGKHGHDEDDDD